MQCFVSVHFEPAFSIYEMSIYISCRGSGHNNNGRGNLHNKNNTRGQHYEVTSSEAMANSNHENKKKSGKTGEKQPPSANAHRVDAPSTEQSASGKVAMY